MPTAKVSSTASGLVDVPLRIDGRASTGAQAYSWEVLDADPLSVHLTLGDEAIAVVTAARPMTFVLKLTVTDEAGDTDAALSIVSVVRAKVPLEVPDSVARYNSFVVTARVPEQIEGPVFTWRCEPEDEVTISSSPEAPEQATVVPQGADSDEVVVSLTLVDASGQRFETEPPSATVLITGPDDVSTGEVEYWEEQIRAGNRAALSNVRASASTWQGMLAGVLGLFGTVTLLGAPAALAEIESRPLAYLAVVLVAAAFLAAVLAVMTVTRIITAGVRIERTPDPATYGQRVIAAAAAATDDLGRSKALAFGAASLIASAGLVLAFGQLGDGELTGQNAPTALVRTADATLCGPMSVDPQSGAVLVTGQEVGASLSVDIVDACSLPGAAEAGNDPDTLPPYGAALVLAAALIGGIVAYADVRWRPWVAPVAAAALVYLLAWAMTGQVLTGWHLWALVAGAIAVPWKRARPAAMGERAAPDL